MYILKRLCIAISIFLFCFSYDCAEVSDADFGFKTFERPCYFVNAENVPEQILRVAEYARIRNSNLSEKQAFEIGDAIWEVSYDYDLEFDLLAALIETESNFRINAVSEMGAKGLTQVMTTFLSGKDCWLQELIRKGIINEEREIFEINKNVMAGAYILKRCVDSSTTLHGALWKYYGDKSIAYANSVMTNLKKVEAF